MCAPAVKGDSSRMAFHAQAVSNFSDSGNGDFTRQNLFSPKNKILHPLTGGGVFATTHPLEIVVLQVVL
jgi:hypothetical protein